MTTTPNRQRALVGAALAILLGSAALGGLALAEPKGPPAERPCQAQGPRGGPQHRADMKVIHALFADRTVTRTVREIPGGVETLTESRAPEGVANIQKHVAAMHARVTEADPIHMRDPLFAELFAHASQITMVVENTANGVRVRETSEDPYVTSLIRAHAAVVTKFIENGWREMRVDHAPPTR